ncbi:MAG: hypothetical protein AB1696_28405 [Planctomycetota bacterium]
MESVLVIVSASAGGMESDVIPAKAGIHEGTVDARFRGHGARIGKVVVCAQLVAAGAGALPLL